MNVHRAIKPALVAFTLLSAGTTFAAESPPQNVVSLQAESTVEVTKDLISLTFTTTKEGADAAAVQSALKQALDAALAEARSAAKPGGQIEVRTGNFSLYPRYAAKSNSTVITGWQGTTELVVEGRDMTGISQLSGRIGTMAISRVATSLSREQREKVEAEVSGQAIARYQAKAATVARQFGFSGYQLREISVGLNEANPFPAPMQMRMKGMAAAAADEALPVEAGKGLVTATVSGSVVLTR